MFPVKDLLHSYWSLHVCLCPTIMSNPLLAAHSYVIKYTTHLDGKLGYPYPSVTSAAIWHCHIYSHIPKEIGFICSLWHCACLRIVRRVTCHKKWSCAKSGYGQEKIWVYPSKNLVRMWYFQGEFNAQHHNCHCRQSWIRITQISLEWYRTII